jgi:hypothetical protein
MKFTEWDIMKMILPFMISRLKKNFANEPMLLFRSRKAPSVFLFDVTYVDSFEILRFCLARYLRVQTKLAKVSHYRNYIANEAHCILSEYERRTLEGTEPLVLQVYYPFTVCT